MKILVANLGSTSFKYRLFDVSGPAERRVSTSGSRVQVWTVPTNEELVLARQCRTLLDSGKQSMM